MPNLSRRQTIKLAAGAAVVGPSVLFSRTADAASDVYALTAGNFGVKVAGEYQWIRGVAKVQLGIAEWSPDSIKPQFGMLKIALATESDAPELAIKFEDINLKKVSDTKLKISVSLFAEEGKTPALTYHAIDAVPHSTSVNKAGNRWINFTVGSMETVKHKVRRGHNSALVELPANFLKVQVGSLKFAAVGKLEKFSYDLKTNEAVKVTLDPAVASITWSEPTKVKKSVSTYEPILFRTAERLAVTSFVSTADKFAWKQLTPDFTKSKALTIAVASKRKGGSGDPRRDEMATDKDINFAKVRLASVEFPNLAVGSTALVTQTYHFAIEPSTG